MTETSFSAPPGQILIFVFCLVTVSVEVFLLNHRKESAPFHVRSTYISVYVPRIRSWWYAEQQLHHFFFVFCRHITTAVCPDGISSCRRTVYTQALGCKHSPGKPSVPGHVVHVAFSPLCNRRSPSPTAHGHSCAENLFAHTVTDSRRLHHDTAKRQQNVSVRRPSRTLPSGLPHNRHVEITPWPRGTGRNAWSQRNLAAPREPAMRSPVRADLSIQQTAHISHRILFTRENVSPSGTHACSPLGINHRPQEYRLSCRYR